MRWGRRRKRNQQFNIRHRRYLWRRRRRRKSCRRRTGWQRRCGRQWRRRCTAATLTGGYWRQWNCEHRWWGGGGGGTGMVLNNNGGSGGSGIVIISAIRQARLRRLAARITTAGGKDIWTFTSSGTFTVTQTATTSTTTVTVTPNAIQDLELLLRSGRQHHANYEPSKHHGVCLLPIYLRRAQSPDERIDLPACQRECDHQHRYS